jgi:hypothetical protein
MKIKELNSLIGIIVLCLPNIFFAQTPNLGTTANYALFTSVGAIDNTGATYIMGNVGTHAGKFSGFPMGIVNGQTHLSDSSTVKAAADLSALYNQLEESSCGKNLDNTLGNKQTLTPGVYCLNGASTLNDYLTLDAKGDPKAVFIFKINGSLVTQTASNVVLVNGASLENVFWQIKDNIVLGKKSVFTGNIVANGPINLRKGAALSGRGLSKSGGIALNKNNCTLISQIDLVSFKGVMQGNNIFLKWTTGSERNIVQIELQRSFNNRDFETLVTFPSAGQVDQNKDYTFTDKALFEKAENVSKKRVYYRLKHVDFNNIFKFSKTLMVSKKGR